MAARPFGRFALCGMISQYNATDMGPGVRGLIMAVGKQLRLEGFIVSSHADMQPAVRARHVGLDRRRAR